MAERIVNPLGDYEETVLQLAKHLGTSKLRRKVFNTIYGRGTSARSKKQLMETAGLRDVGTISQQVQNELDHLAKHHLVVRIDNVGTVRDGSRYLYQKDSTVRALRDRIVKYADDRKAAAKVPTKRRPSTTASIATRGAARAILRKRKHLHVLYLAANPEKSSPIRVDVEVQRVQDAIRGSVYRDSVTLHYRPAANLTVILNGLNDFRPQVVHFSGHGNRSGIATDNAKIRKPGAVMMSFDLLARALAATDQPPKVVVLNACESSAARRALLSVAKIIISMRTSVTDVAASAFAVRFYAAVASGQSIRHAFEQGKVAVQAVSLDETDIPELIYQPGIDPRSVALT